MLSGLGFAMVAIFMTLITTRRLSALAALILVPTAVALVAGFGPDIGPMMLKGIKDLAPTAVMLLFAILYFGVMIDAGLFEPLVRAIVRATANDPVRTMFGVVVLALVVGLDGDGSTTYMITIVAMLPLFKRQKLDVRMLACLAIMASGVSNLLPWGGPTARAATALHLDARACSSPCCRRCWLPPSGCSSSPGGWGDASGRAWRSIRRSLSRWSPMPRTSPCSPRAARTPSGRS